MTAIVNTLIDAFEMHKYPNMQEETSNKLSKEITEFLDQEGDLKTAIQAAYRLYMDAEAPQNWLNATERRLIAYTQNA